MLPPRTPAAPPRVREDEVRFDAVRAQGPGGQNVHKVSSAAQLRFDIVASSLPDALKARLLALHDRRISAAGVVVIKAQRHRSLEMNRADALARLQALVDSVAAPPLPRRPTRPTRASVRRRLADKAQRATIKAGRRGEGD
jgi:ribosome-associated protein